MRKNVIWVCFFAAVIALIGLTNTASATILTGSDQALGSTSGSFAAGSTTIGPVLFTTPGGDQANVTETVGNFSANPFGPSALTFEWTVSVIANTSGGASIIKALSTFDYAGYMTDAAVISAPGAVSGSFDGVNDNITYNPALGNSMTATIVLMTNASKDTFGGVSIQDSGSANGASNTWLAPLTGGPTVMSPEPASLTLCVIGLVTLGGVGAWRRRSRREI